MCRRWRACMRTRANSPWPQQQTPAQTPWLGHPGAQARGRWPAAGVRPRRPPLRPSRRSRLLWRPTGAPMGRDQGAGSVLPRAPAALATLRTSRQLAPRQGRAALLCQVPAAFAQAMGQGQGQELLMRPQRPLCSCGRSGRACGRAMRRRAPAPLAALRPPPPGSGMRRRPRQLRLHPPPSLHLQCRSLQGLLRP